MGQYWEYFVKLFPLRKNWNLLEGDNTFIFIFLIIFLRKNFSEVSSMVCLISKSRKLRGKKKNGKEKSSIEMRFAMGQVFKELVLCFKN